MAITAASIANAQGLSPIREAKDPHHRYLSHLLHSQASKALAKTTVDKQRIIAEHSFDMATPTAAADSMHYYYSGTNGSKFNYDYMYFDYYYPMNLNPSDYPYLWDVVDVLADSVKMWVRDTSGNFILGDRTHASFTASKKVSNYIQDYFLDGAADGSDRFLNSFNSLGNITQMIGLTEVGSGFDSTAKILFYYNSQNQRIADSIWEYDAGDWNATAAVSYTYDAAGNITRMNVFADAGAPIGWINALRYDHTFYTNNTLKTVIGYQFGGGGGLAPVVKDTFVHDPSGNFSIHLWEYNYNAGAWVPSIAIDKTLNSAGMPDTVTTSTWNTVDNEWTPSSVVAFTYNSFQNPESYMAYDPAVTPAALTSTHNYYYEVYDEPNTVGNTTKTEKMTVYPNPANNTVSIRREAADGKSVTVQLLNAAGQISYSESFNWNKQTQQIGLNSLSAGMYWLVVRDVQGNVLHRQGLLKQ